MKNIRRMVYALRPPALDDLGLIPAVEAHVDQQVRSLGELQVEVNAPREGLPPLSAAVEVAVYHIILEAFTNVIRHARAQTCQINLSVIKEQPRELHVEIIDDGRGMSPDAKIGVGLNAMRERAEEVGGTFDMQSGRGLGARVRASIPLFEREG